MTVSRERNLIYFECDEPSGCPEVLDTQHSEFEDAMVEFRDTDWEMRQTRNGWRHFCPVHSEDLEWTRAPR